MVCLKVSVLTSAATIPLVPEAKKIDHNLYEIRISLEGAYRGFYAYIEKEFVMILHLFRKKGQKTPLKNLKLARRRLKNYEY